MVQDVIREMPQRSVPFCEKNKVGGKRVAFQQLYVILRVAMTLNAVPSKQNKMAGKRVLFQQLYVILSEAKDPYGGAGRLNARKRIVLANARG